MVAEAWSEPDGVRPETRLFCNSIIVHDWSTSYLADCILSVLFII